MCTAPNGASVPAMCARYLLRAVRALGCVATPAVALHARPTICNVSERVRDLHVVMTDGRVPLCTRHRQAL